MRELCSAFAAGLLPAPHGTVLGRSYFDQSRRIGLFYPSDTSTSYDVYSKVLHQMSSADSPLYTFAYDDALGQDGTVHAQASAKAIELKVCLGDCSGTQIPDPISGSASAMAQSIPPVTVTVTVTLGKTASGKHYPLEVCGQAKNTSLNWFQVGPGPPVTFENVMGDNLSVRLDGEDYSVHLRSGMVTPHSSISDGIVVVRSDENVVVNFPGPPS